MTNTHFFAQNGNYQCLEITPTPTENMEEREGGGRETIVLTTVVGCLQEFDITLILAKVLI